MSFKYEINLESLINTLVRVVVEFLILFVLYFWVLGTNTNLQNSWLFFIVSFVLLVSVVPVQVQFELIDKHAYRWKDYFDRQRNENKITEYKETKLPSNFPLNIWKNAFQLTLPCCLFGAGSLIIYHYFFKDVIWLEIVFIGFLTIAIIVPLVLSLNKRCLFPVCFFLLNNKTEPTHVMQPTDDYFFYHHIQPWLPTTLLTSGLLTYKMTEEALFANNSLAVFSTAMYATSSSYAVLLWMWYESKNQAKVERRMQLFDHEKVGKITSDELWFLIHLVAVSVLVMSLIIGYVFFNDGFSQMFIIIYVTSVAVLTGALGNILGVISTKVENVDITDEF